MSSLGFWRSGNGGCTYISCSLKLAAGVIKNGKKHLCRNKKIMHIAAMSSPLDHAVIEARKLAIEASYQRQLNLVGKSGYDPRLTVQLKQDLDWLNEQKSGSDPSGSR
jgi:hypothetical protein